MARTLEIYEEPARGGFGPTALLGLSGLDRMRAAIAGLWPAPPVNHLTGLVPTEAGPGTATFEMPASPWWQTAAGAFPPGVMAWIADGPLGSAILTALPPGRVMTTSDLSINYLRPATVASRKLIGKARLIEAGRSLALAEATIEDAQGKTLAHVTTRGFLFDPISPPPDPPESLEPYVPEPHDTPDPYLREPVRGDLIPQEVWNSTKPLDVTRGFLDGRYSPPPIMNLTGLCVTACDEGSVDMTVPASPWLASPSMIVYGGAIALFADFSVVIAASHTTGPATVVSPLDLKVSFIRPVFPDGRNLTIRGRVLHRGRKMVVANADVTNADGKVVALATGSALVLPDRPWPGAEPVAPADEAPDAFGADAES